MLANRRNIEPGGGVILALMNGPAHTQGERIRFARQHAKLTQSELAARVNSIARVKTTKALVSMWESDKVQKPQSIALLAVAQATGFTPQWIQTGRGPRMVHLPRLKSELHTEESRAALRRAVIIALHVHKEAQAVANATVRVYETICDEPSAPEAALRRVARHSAV